jgi:hypothetical protein
MALREIKVGGQTILVEVIDLTVEGQTPGAGGRFEDTSATDKLGDMGGRVSDLLKAMTTPVQAALKAAAADEWTLEVCLGFKGETGVPFIASGEANAAVKVTAKWKKGP